MLPELRLNWCFGVSDISISAEQRSISTQGSCPWVPTWGRLPPIDERLDGAHFQWNQSPRFPLQGRSGVYRSHLAARLAHSRVCTDTAGCDQYLGGSVLDKSNAAWFRVGAGFDFDGLLVAELGYNRAVIPDLDASVAVKTNVGFATGRGGTLRVRWAALRWKTLRLAADLPLTATWYTASSPNLVMLGAEPGVLASNVFGGSFGVFYGAALRFYEAASTYFVGPQGRLGVAWAFGDFRLAFGTSVSRVVVSYTPTLTLFSADLGLSYGFGDRDE